MDQDSWPCVLQGKAMTTIQVTAVKCELGRELIEDICGTAREQLQMEKEPDDGP